MKITIESTTKTTSLDGVRCRIWEGETERGIKIHCYIPRIAARDDQDLSQFEAELTETRPPSPDVAWIPQHMKL